MARIELYRGEEERIAVVDYNSAEMWWGEAPCDAGLIGTPSEQPWGREERQPDGWLVCRPKRQSALWVRVRED